MPTSTVIYLQTTLPHSVINQDYVISLKQYIYIVFNQRNYNETLRVPPKTIKKSLVSPTFFY